MAAITCTSVIGWPGAPVRDGGEQCQCRFPGWHVAEGAESLVASGRDERHAPGTGVTGQGEDGYALEVLQQRVAFRRAAPVRGTVMPGVVHKPAVLSLLGGTAGADSLQHGAHRGPAAGGVDHQVGAGHRCLAGQDPGDVRYSVNRFRPGDQPRYCGAPADRQAGSLLRDRGDGGLQDRPACCHRLETLIARPPAAGHLGGKRTHHVGTRAAHGLEFGYHRGQLAFHQRPPAGHHEVELAELVHPAPLPPLPQFPGAPPRGRGVTFQDSDPVPVASEQHPRGQPVEPCPHHYDLCHCSSPLSQVRWLAACRAGLHAVCRRCADGVEGRRVLQFTLRPDTFGRPVARPSP